MSIRLISTDCWVSCSCCFGVERAGGQSGLVPSYRESPGDVQSPIQVEALIIRRAQHGAQRLPELPAVRLHFVRIKCVAVLPCREDREMVRARRGLLEYVLNMIITSASRDRVFIISSHFLVRTHFIFSCKYQLKNPRYILLQFRFPPVLVIRLWQFSALQRHFIFVVVVVRRRPVMSQLLVPRDVSHSDKDDLTLNAMFESQEWLLKIMLRSGSFSAAGPMNTLTLEPDASRDVFSGKIPLIVWHRRTRGAPRARRGKAHSSRSRPTPWRGDRC